MSKPQIHRVESDVYDPAGGDAGSIVGKNLTGTTAVRIGVTACTNVTVVSDTSVTFTAPAKAAGTYPIAVRNADGWTSLANAVQYANPGTIPNCVWWLRPDDADVDVDGSTEVTAWRDKSGVGDTNRNVTPPTADNPAWNSADADYGGKPTVGSFNRVGNFRLTSGVWSATYSTYSMGTIGHSPSNSSRYSVCGLGAANRSGLTNNGGNFQAYSGAIPTALVQTNPPNPALKRSTYLSVWNGASSFIYAEGAVTAGTHEADVLGVAGMSIGSYPATSETFGVERLAEVYAYSRALTLREVRTLRRYRDSYYGAPA